MEKEERIEKVMEIMEKELENARKELLECTNIDKIDSLAYKLIVKNEIFGAIDYQMVEIDDYIDKLEQIEKPLARLYKIFSGTSFIEERIVADDTIYECLENL